MFAVGDDEEAPLRTREDILPWVSFGGGMLTAIGGALIGGVGAWPALAMLRAQLTLDDAAARTFMEGDQSLLSLRRAEVYDRNLAFQRWGAPLLGAGLALLTLGGLMAAGGIYSGVVMTAGE